MRGPVDDDPDEFTVLFKYASHKLKRAARKDEIEPGLEGAARILSQWFDELAEADDTARSEMIRDAIEELGGKP